MNFAAIDFETATGIRNSACAVGIVTVENGTVTDEYYSLIQPPDNYYWNSHINIHKITPADTKNYPVFTEVYPDIRKRLAGKTVVAHNEVFDRNVLLKTMSYYGLDYSELNLLTPWECTCKIYRAKGFKPANLASCCSVMNIELNHHEALSDAGACAMLFLKRYNY
jgi:DNA polymerase III subunit epsilon